MLRATTSRRGLFTVAYDVRLDGRRVTGWTARTRRPERELVIDGAPYVLRADGIARFRLDGEHSARCTRIGRHWEMTAHSPGHPDEAYRLVGSELGRRFRVDDPDDGAEVGRIVRSGALRPSYTVDLTPGTAVPVQVFLLWVAMAIWRSTTASAAATSPSAG